MPRTSPNPQLPPDEVVDPVWLLKALGLTIMAAIVCAWLALCLLYYQGSWQLVLHPLRTIDQTPSAINLTFEDVHFDASATGQSRLTGWWIPAGPQVPQGASRSATELASDTVLYLHDGTGSLSQALPSLALLHAAGINVFAFDYRGFGRSDNSGHPTSATMAADASAALVYLTGTRHIPASHIVPHGSGLGASLALGLAQQHPELRAVILDNPDPDPTATAIAAHPSHIVPIRLLYHESFEIAGPLHTIATPKLLITGGPNARSTKSNPERLSELFRNAASPYFSVDLPTHGPDAALVTALTRFLDQYLPFDGLHPAPQTR
ncbi:MAG: hypothetical protein NVSMB62_13460 [Acidobacteriaceae bacterium]